MKSMSIFWVLFFGFSIIAFSEQKMENWQLSCAAIDTQNRFLSVSNGKDVAFLTEFRFEGSPFVESRLSCAQWVEFVESEYPELQISDGDIKRLLTSENKPAARLEGDARKILYELCNKHPFCQIRFPYSLHLGIDMFRGSSAKSGFTQPDICFEKTSTPIKFVVENQSEVMLSESAKIATTWMSPPNSYGSEVEKVLNHKANELVVMTALGASFDELERIKKIIPAGKKLLVLLDFYILLIENRLPDFINLQSDSFYILPMFNTPHYRRAYHIKGAAGFDKYSPGVLTSSNIKNKTNLETLDFGMTFHGRHGHELANFLVRDAIDACMQIPYANCTLEQRYSLKNPYREAFDKMFFRSCQMMRASTEIRQAIAVEPKLQFLSTSYVDIEALVKAMISSAKKNIIIVSDQVGHEEVLQSLNDAAKKGVNVDVVYGKQPLVDVSSYSQIRFHKAANATGKNHAKGMLFDGKKLFVGSGNITKTGLGQAREVFVLTEHSDIVSGFRDYLKTLNSTYGLTLQ